MRSEVRLGLVVRPLKIKYNRLVHKISSASPPGGVHYLTDHGRYTHSGIEFCHKDII